MYVGNRLHTCTDGCSSRRTGSDRRRPRSGPASCGVPVQLSGRSWTLAPPPPALPPRLLLPGAVAESRGLGPAPAPRRGDAVRELPPPGLLLPPGVLGALQSTNCHVQSFLVPGATAVTESLPNVDMPSLRRLLHTVWWSCNHSRTSAVLRAPGATHVPARLPGMLPASELRAAAGSHTYSMRTSRCSSSSPP